MGWLLILLSLATAWLSFNLYLPRSAGSRAASLSFVAGWLTGELALHLIALQALVVWAFAALGALDGLAGRVGLGILLLAWIGLGVHYIRAWRVEPLLEDVLRTQLGATYVDEILPGLSRRFPAAPDWRSLLRPFRLRDPDVERIRNVVFARVRGIDLRLDVYRHRSQPTDCPVLLQVHGGAWTIGSKDQQALPLMNHMAARGWVCVAANYRLSPHSTFPEHLVDVKQALRWIRTDGGQYGANPDFIVVTGGSAGGHLAALVALTGNDPEYQPGFEDVDTSVSGCVPFYGIYDFVDGERTWHHAGLKRLLEHKVMKASLDEAPDAYRRASPRHRVHGDAPPFLVIHGSADTLVPVEQARLFVSDLRAASRASVAYAEIPGAQHAFELFGSLRAWLTVHGVERFLAHTYSGYLRSRGGEPARDEVLPSMHARERAIAGMS